MITGHIVATGTHNVIEGNQVDTCTVGINVTSGTNTAQALVNSAIKSAIAPSTSPRTPPARWAPS